MSWQLAADWRTAEAGADRACAKSGNCGKPAECGEWRGHNKSANPDQYANSDSSNKPRYSDKPSNKGDSSADDQECEPAAGEANHDGNSHEREPRACVSAYQPLVAAENAQHHQPGDGKLSQDAVGRVQVDIDHHI